MSVTFQASCPAVSPCGGDVVGAWVYTGACIEDVAFTSVWDQACGVGKTVFSNKAGSVQGTMTFDGVEVTRVETSQLSYRATVSTGACVSGCALLPSFLPSFASGTCALSSGKCVCDLTANIGNNTSGTYTVDAGVINSGTIQARYCRSGTSFSFRDQSSTPLAGSFTVGYSGPP